MRFCHSGAKKIQVVGANSFPHVWGHEVLKDLWDVRWATRACKELAALNPRP